MSIVNSLGWFIENKMCLRNTIYWTRQTNGQANVITFIFQFWTCRTLNRFVWLIYYCVNFEFLHKTWFVYWKRDLSRQNMPTLFVTIVYITVCPRKQPIWRWLVCAYSKMSKWKFFNPSILMFEVYVLYIVVPSKQCLNLWDNL